MGWQIYEDTKGRPLRWAGYGVPAYCDHPKCSEEIDRGVSHHCGEVNRNEEDGCGLHFCEKHLNHDHLCERCTKRKDAFEPKPDHPEWSRHVLTDESWKQWRDENPKYAEQYNEYSSTGGKHE